MMNSILGTIQQQLRFEDSNQDVTASCIFTDTRDPLFCGPYPKRYLHICGGHGFWIIFTFLVITFSQSMYLNSSVKQNLSWREREMFSCWVSNFNWVTWGSEETPEKTDTRATSYAARQSTVSACLVRPWRVGSNNALFCLPLLQP